MTPANRPARPTISQLREITQPDSILIRANSEHWLGPIFFRKISPHLTRLFISLNFSPNAITYLMIVVGKLSAASLLINGIPGAITSALLAQLQMIIDCCDGEVARWKNISSPSGIFLDKVAHATAESLIPLALGVRAAGGISAFSATPTWWPFLGALLAVFVLLNKSLNDAVHVARAKSGMEKLQDVRAVSTPQNSILSNLRSLTRIFPFQRIFHSIEMTALAIPAAIIDSTQGNNAATQHGLIVLTILAALTVVGHFLSIMSSSRLK